MAKMNVNSLITKDYRKNDVFAAQKTNPIQTQSKPVLSAACPERSRMGRMGQFQTAGKRTKEAKKKKRLSGSFLRLWLAGKIDFLDGCDIILGKIYGKSQFNLFWRLIL